MSGVAVMLGLILMGWSIKEGLVALADAIRYHAPPVVPLSPNGDVFVRPNAPPCHCTPWGKP